MEQRINTLQSSQWKCGFKKIKKIFICIFTVSKSPDVHVLSARRGEIKTCIRPSEQIQGQFVVPLHKVLRASQCGLTVGPEGRQDGRRDQLLHRRLHPPLSIDHPGSLRQTATELVVPPWTTRRTSEHQHWLLILNSRLHVYLFFYLPRRRTCADTGRPAGCSCWSAALVEKDNVWKHNNHHLKQQNIKKTRQKTWDTNVELTLRTWRQRSSPELWRPPSWWTQTADGQTDRSFILFYLFYQELIVDHYYAFYFINWKFNFLPECSWALWIKSDLFETCNINKVCLIEESKIECFSSMS